MRSISHDLLGMICIQILVCASAFAQRRPAASSGTRPAASSQEKRVESSYAVSEFDVHAGNLPAQYKGYDIVKLSENLAAREKSKAKGEFETTEQWQERLKAEQSAPVLGGLRLPSIYAFAMTLGPSTPKSQRTDLAYEPLNWWQHRPTTEDRQDTKSINLCGGTP